MVRSLGFQPKNSSSILGYATNLGVSTSGMSAVFKTASKCVQSIIVGSSPTAPAKQLKINNMTIEQVENFNKRSFPYVLQIKGSHTYLTKYLLDNIIEDSTKPMVEVDLITAPKEIIFIMKNDFLTKLFIEDNVLFINMENE